MIHNDRMLPFLSTRLIEALCQKTDMIEELIGKFFRIFIFSEDIFIPVVVLLQQSASCAMILAMIH